MVQTWHRNLTDAFMDAGETPESAPLKEVERACPQVEGHAEG